MRTKRTGATVEGYAIVLLSEVPPTGSNAVQRQTGVDITTHMKGEIPYSSLRIIHIPLVREELTFRGEIFDEKESITKSVKQLKESNIQAQKVEIEARTGNKNPKESDLQLKVFLPLCRSADAYGIANPTR